ncbi:TonB-dependent receptor [Polluticaenibacter yanchengensis]|uniref:TonB-dependent receptor n=1 Tax=Polluticaenibacter yanchengensis TaxID=3014562 RepID=A0ABT4UME7_9BACT|nr:TonB-dependent receptor [Chitinophagaceae bacterium LY-5]
MKSFFLSAVMLLLPVLLLAQFSTLNGKVTMDDGKPASRVTITVKGTKVAGTSDDNGKYELKNIPYGKHTVVFSSVEIKEQAITIIFNKTTQALNITAIPAEDSNLDDVVIEGATQKKKIETTGFAVSVIETKEASLRNLQTNELLDRAVGVRVRQNGGIGSEVEYNLNGMTGRSVGVFIDGIEISTYGSSFNLNNIPPAMIDRIEVYKGVLPSHLAGDYMGGAINVVLKKDAGQNNISASVSYGSFNTFQADASLMTRAAKSGFTVKASGFYTHTDNSYEIWGKFSKFVAPNGVVTRNHRAKRFNDEYRSAGGRVELGFTNVKWADQFLLGYNGSDTYNEIPHGQTMGRPYVGRFSEADAHVLSVVYNKKNLFIKGLTLNFNGVYSDRNTYIQDTSGWVYNWDGNPRLDIYNRPMYRINQGQQGAKTMNSINRKITTVRANLSYDIISGHRLSVNHMYYTVDRNDNDIFRPVGDDIYRTINDIAKNVTAFNYEAQTFGNKLKTNVFVKLYQQSTGRTAPDIKVVNGQTVVTTVVSSDNRSTTGYGMALSYTFLPKLMFVGSAERAVRMPGESEIFGDPADNVIANPGIRPEVSENYNAGLRLDGYKIDKHRFTVSGNLFWRNVKDRIMRQANTNLSDQEIELSPFVNIGLAQALGFEGELMYNYAEKLNVMFNFSKFNSLYKQEFDAATGQRLSDYYNKQLPNEPFYTMNGNAQYRFNNLIQKKSIINLYYNFGYVASFRTIWPESEWFTTPTQFSHDLGVSYRTPNRKIVVSFDAKNLFNQEMYDNFGVQKPGRAFYLKLNYTITNF